VDLDVDVDLDACVDHHCHGLFHDDLTTDAFEAAMNESAGRSPLGTTPCDSMLGLAIRRWCAPVLGLEPGAAAESYLRQRQSLGAAEVNRRLVGAAGIEVFLVDTGLWSDRLSSPEQLVGAPAGSAHEILRLESVAEDLLTDGVGPAGFAEAFAQRLQAAAPVGAKSIAAYRTGLELVDAKPSADELVSALEGVVPDSGGRIRLADPVVHAWLAWTAIELGLPLQFHAGYGDSDLDLLAGDPLRLTRFLRATEERGVAVLLLHNYPYHRQAAYLAQVFEHVFMDVGLATHNTGAFSDHVLREAMELAPFGKLLFSTDAYGRAEHFLLGTLLFRRGLASLLHGLVERGEASAADAARIGALIVRDNARRIYRLPEAD
jgi:predicted TIM-barrel fold metal-dependent hydrolase